MRAAMAIRSASRRNQGQIKTKVNGKAAERSHKLIDAIMSEVGGTRRPLGLHAWRPLQRASPSLPPAQLGQPVVVLAATQPAQGDPNHMPARGMWDFFCERYNKGDKIGAARQCKHGSGGSSRGASRVHAARRPCSLDTCHLLTPHAPWGTCTAKESVR